MVRAIKIMTSIGHENLENRITSLTYGDAASSKAFGPPIRPFFANSGGFLGLKMDLWRFDFQEALLI
ncbi:hypothetical protein BST81_06670 [Leptolyngbya sp. 'hensonii']|nr:hypothetical protein BST81_06670 [Leptolyngbya sp. 'hensonii']